MNPNTAALWQVIVAGINALLLFATLIVLVFYTKFTYRIQKTSHEQTDELIRQRKLSNLPAFIASPIEPGQSNRISLHNIGKGVAVNVHCDDVHVPYDLHPDARIILPPIGAISPGASAHSGVSFAGLGDRHEHHRAVNAPPIENYLNDQDYVLTVNFNDVEGNAYRQTLVMRHGHCFPAYVCARVGAQQGSERR